MKAFTLHGERNNESEGMLKGFKERTELITRGVMCSRNRTECSGMYILQSRQGQEVTEHEIAVGQIQSGEYVLKAIPADQSDQRVVVEIEEMRAKKGSQARRADLEIIAGKVILLKECCDSNFYISAAILMNPESEIIFYSDDGSYDRDSGRRVCRTNVLQCDANGDLTLIKMTGAINKLQIAAERNRVQWL